MQDCIPVLLCSLKSWPGKMKPITVGVANEACRTDALQREAHDIPLDMIVTEAACYPEQGQQG